MKAVTINSKNIGKILQRAIKALKEAPEPTYEFFCKRCGSILHEMSVKYYTEHLKICTPPNRLLET